MKTIKILLFLTLVMCGCRTSTTQLENKSIKEEKMKRKRPVLDSTIKDEKLKEFIWEKF